MGMNRNKNKFDDVLDPFQLRPDTFVLNLASGEISPAPGIPADVNTMAIETINRLKLNDPETQRMRAEHYSDYISGEISEAYLQRKSPFVWYEAQRQGLL
jgi:hypothetical protein